MNYNPYDLVPLLINGKPITGRPFEFDSDITNQKTMKNAFGNYVKPTKVMSVCPDCGQGLQISLKLGDPPFQPITYSCQYCCPAPPPLVDPFINPLESGRVPVAELDPLLHNPDKPLAAGKTAVADRFEVPTQVLSVAPAIQDELDLAPGVSARSQDKRKQEQSRIIPLEKADGINEEFDDSSMVEEEEEEAFEDE